MSKKAKKATKDRNRAAKRAKKLANREKYQAWAASGQNSKSKRVKIKSRKNKLVITVSHPNGECGNIGCSRCNPKGH